MANEILTPSINMLPMENIKQFLDSTLTAKNTLAVGGLTANQVAKNFNGESESVKKAYFLGDRPAADYLTKDDSPEIHIANVSKIVEDEVSKVRLELYRMMAQLNPRTENKLQAEYGFIEPFNELPLETTTASFTAKNGFIETLKPQKVGFAIPGEYIVLSWLNEKHVVQITSTTNNILTLSSLKVKVPTIQVINLFHFKGENKNNKNFSFSNTAQYSVSEKPYNVFLGDYSQEGKGAVQRGISTSITLRSSMFDEKNETIEAILDSVKVHVSQKGYPSSALICRIYRRFDDNIKNISLIGESDAINAPQDGWLNIAVKNMAGEPLVVTKDLSYLIAFESAIGTQEDTFVIKTGKGNANDLHTNREIYRRIANEYILESTPYDILLGLNFKSIELNTPIPFNNGLYTSNDFEIKQSSHKAYCHMRFTKEKTTTAQLDTITNSKIGFTVVTPFNLALNERFVVGNAVATLAERKDNILKTNETLSVYPNDTVYPIPFKMQLIVKSDYFETTFVQTIPFILSNVHANHSLYNPTLSDYLIFECTLPDKAKLAKLQIVYDDPTKTQSFTMMIEELSLSVSKAISNDAL